jgi:hypothetical protein
VEADGGSSFIIRGEDVASSMEPKPSEEVETAGQEGQAEGEAAEIEPIVTDKVAEAADVESVATGNVFLPSRAEMEGQQEAVATADAPRTGPQQVQNLLAQPMESIQSAGSAFNSVQLTPVTVMMVRLGLSAYACMGVYVLVLWFCVCFCVCMCVCVCMCMRVCVHALVLTFFL